MKWDVEVFDRLIDTEEYFEFFQLSYDPQIVHVNRLHILKQFSHYIHQIDTDNPEVSKAEKLSLYRLALKQAYEVFLSSTPLEQKLFKVFNEKPHNVVLLTEIGAD